ncbi:MAG: OmpA family protein [Treponema sp.]|jgi:outer membrane protein OmpA-like peptidoglycan-associated protein|nr:OmpA family protein [Treponema sp.]
MKKIFAVIFFIGISNLFAENEFSLRIAPTIDVPLSIAEFNTGVGAAALLDWGFWQFADDFNFGFSMGGTFTSLPFETGDSLTLMGGTLGAFLRWRPLDRLAFRAGVNGGVYQYIRAGKSAANPQFSSAFGGEFLLSPSFSLFADAGYTFRVFSGSKWNAEPLNSLGMSFGFRLNLSEIMGGKARVRLDKTQQFRVFPVSFAWYEFNPVATVKVTNEEPNAITDVALSFFMDSYMSQPWIFAELPHLGAGESAYVPVTALFNEAMMNLTETVNAHGTIQMQYRSLGSRKDTNFAIDMPVFHRNTLSWDDDRRAAAFVSPYDFAARFFARYVESAVNRTQSQMINVPSNVLNAAALFEALRLYGISYVVVPATSFARVAADESVLDNVSFPYQALFYRGGDCSYLSILFCSMLEALGIESAFITIPGHIFIAFEVGDENWYAFNGDIIELDGKRWLPVELTIPGEGFTRAWRVGARQWRNSLARGDAALLPIREAWDLYPSVTVTASGDQLPEMPQQSEIIRALVNETSVFRWTDQMAAAAERERIRRRGADAEALARNEVTAAQITTILEEQNITDVNIEASATGIMFRLSDIQFLANSAELAGSEVLKLQEIANILMTLPDRRIIVAGHTAMAGSAAARRITSEQRAQAVAAFLVELGAVDAANITAVGHGADRPIADNSTPEGMTANRRVEIVISN